MPWFHQLIRKAQRDKAEHNGRDRLPSSQLLTSTNEQEEHGGKHPCPDAVLALLRGALRPLAGDGARGKVGVLAADVGLCRLGVSGQSQEAGGEGRMRMEVRNGWLLHKESRANTTEVLVARS